MYKALEQFEYINISYKILNIFDLIVVNPSFNLIFFIVILYLGMFTYTYRTETVLMYGMNFLSNFVKYTIFLQLGRRGETFYLALFATFFTILYCNFEGVLPGNFCITTQLGFTLSLSMSIFGCCIIYIIKAYGISRFLKMFIPKGISILLLKIFLYCIEVISFSSRVLSLAIRLFANMVAGHTLLHILVNGLLSMLKLIKKIDIFLFIFFIIPICIILLIYNLEFCIAFLQSYVFIVLSLIYIKDIYELH